MYVLVYHKDLGNLLNGFRPKTSKLFLLPLKSLDGVLLLSLSV